MSTCPSLLVFADTHVEQAVRLAIARQDNAPLRSQDVEGLTKLGIHVDEERSPSSLEGLECLTKLRALEIDWREYEAFRANNNRQIKRVFTADAQVDLSPLWALAELEELRVVGARVTGLQALLKLQRLRVLDLRRTSVNAPAFRSLTHGKNEVRDLSSLANLTELVELHLRHAQVDSFTGVTSLTKLAILDLGHNQLDDLRTLSELRGLTTLDVSHNRISDLSPLASLSTLTRVDVSYNPLSDLSPLLSLPNLARVNINFTLSDCAAQADVVTALLGRGVQVGTSCP